MNGKRLWMLVTALACALLPMAGQAEASSGFGWFAEPSQTVAPTPESAPTPEPAPEPSQPDVRLDPLQKGDKGGGVRGLQQALIELGYLAGSADGDFGGKTEEAVRQAQAMAGLPVTGVADGDFLASLYSGAVPASSGAWVRLAPRVVRYSATSQHSDKYGSYTVGNAFDGRLDTTWAEDAKGNGEGEAIYFTVATFGQDSVALDIYGGYQKQSSIYYNNGRPRDILLTVNGREFNYTLADSYSAQTFNLPNPSGAPFMELGIALQSVYPGKKWQDTCICEIQVR